MRISRTQKAILRATQQAAIKEEISNYDMFDLVYQAYDNSDFELKLDHRDIIHTVNTACWGEPSTIVWEINGSPAKSIIIATHINGLMCNPTFIIRLYGQAQPTVVSNPQMYTLMRILFKGWMKTNMPEAS